MIQINDYVRITGGTAAVGDIGLVVKLTAVMAALRLHETGVSVRKKQTFLTVVEAPVAPATATVTGLGSPTSVMGDVAETEHEPMIANPNGYTDILIDVPNLTDANRHSLVESAFAAIEAVTGAGSIQVGNLSKGLVFRNMGQIKFRMTSADSATLIVSRFATSLFVLGDDLQQCTISFAEAGEKGPARVQKSRNKNVFNDVSNSSNSTNHRGNSSHINRKALPSGRSLADRLASQEGGGRPRQRRRRW